jgi:hypothetical protein
MNASDTLWAWVTETPDGKVSLVGVMLPPAGHTPLISHSEASVRVMEPLARAHGKASGQKVWLRRYAVQEEIGRA